jgi:hypothetical protein
MLPATVRSKILSSFRRSEHLILRPTQILQTYRRNRRIWGLPAHVNERNIIAFLISEGGLRELMLATTSAYPSIRRYAWRAVSPYKVALSARTDTYFSHATALALHGLTKRAVTTLYVNQEQSPKATKPLMLTQEGIDRAFSNRQRLSAYTLKYSNFRIVLLSGKNTGQLGVIQVSGPEGERLPATNIERTLVDIVVRPAYGGDIADILSAFSRALRMVSVNRLVSILKRLGHAYPYHQAIGFCMERAGYPEAALRQLERLGIKFDFYLAHGLKKTSYSKRWHLYYPRGL